MNNDLISIVVPCYKVEKYVEKCMESLINQTYSNIEILMINDGSPDNTSKLIKKYEKKDKRIKLYEKENGGLSDARNYGLEHSKGKYICFIDSDDYVDKQYIEKLYNSIITNNADISVCDYWYTDEEKNTWARKEIKSATYSNIEALRDFFTSQKLGVETWNKMYATDLFKKNNIKFPIGKIHEDNHTTYKLFYYSKKINLINDRLYYYLQRENSIMNKKFNEKRFDILLALEETHEFIKDNNISLETEYIAYEAMIKLNLINNMIRDNYKGDRLNSIKNEVISKKKTYLKNKKLRFKFKLMISVININFELYKKVL